MERTPLVTIQCLVYNHEPYLRQCLEGFVMQQTSFPFEAIVHDDASTDGSAAIICEYAEKYPDIIKPIYETENQYSKHDGSLARIMDAAMHPGSKYVALCEGDDYWTDPLKLQKQVDVLEEHPNCTIVFCKVNTITRDGKPMDWTIPSVESKIPVGELTLDDFMREEYYYARWTFHTSTFLFRKNCIELHDQLRKTLYKHFPFSDQPIILSCLLQGKGYYIPESTGCYRVSSGGYFSTIKSEPRKLIKFNEDIIRASSDLNDYTQGRYRKGIKRRSDMSRYEILKVQYFNGMMNGWERIKFLFFDLWNTRRSYSSIKLSVGEFLSCVYPEWHSRYKAMINHTH